MAFEGPYGGNEGVQETIIKVEVAVGHDSRLGMASRVVYQSPRRCSDVIDQVPAGYPLQELVHNACCCVLAEVEQGLPHLPRAALQVVDSVVHVSSGQLVVTAGFAVRRGALLRSPCAWR